MLSISISAVKRNSRTEIDHYVVSFKDLHQLELIRKQFLQAEQLAVVGGLSAGIAHEIKNPLGSMKGLVQLMIEDAHTGTISNEYLFRISKDIERIDKVVNNVLSFSQARDLEINPVYINDILRMAQNNCETQYTEKKIKVLFNLSSSLPDYHADGEKLYSAFYNIIKNAYDLMEPMNTLTLETKRVPVQPFVTKYSFFLNNQDGIEFKRDDGILIIISNTGTQIEDVNIDRVFNPFFTSKTTGTGLGLAICKQIIDAHCGKIDVLSEKNRVSFRIMLPVFKMKGISHEAQNSDHR